MNNSKHNRPEPVTTRAKITAAISGLVSLLVTLGILPGTLGAQLSGAADAVVSAVCLVLAVVPVIVHAVGARKAVTPTSDPRNDAGQRLVPVGSQPATGDAAAALAAAEAIRPSASPSS